MLDAIKILSYEGEISDLLRRANEIKLSDFSIVEGNNSVQKNNWETCSYRSNFYTGLLEVDEEEVREDAMHFIRNYTVRPEKVNIDMSTIISYIDFYQKIEEKLSEELRLHPDSNTKINELMRKNEQAYQLLHSEHIKRVKWIPKNAFQNLQSIENFYYLLCVKIRNQENSHVLAGYLVEALEDLVFVLSGFTSLKMMEEEDKKEVEITTEKLNDLIKKISRLKETTQLDMNPVF